MSHVEWKFKIDTDEVCILCAHIKGLCKCDVPRFMPIPEWLHVDHLGHRTYQERK